MNTAGCTLTGQLFSKRARPFVQLVSSCLQRLDVPHVLSISAALLDLKSALRCGPICEALGYSCHAALGSEAKQGPFARGTQERYGYQMPNQVAPACSQLVPKSKSNKSMQCTVKGLHFHARRKGQFADSNQQRFSHLSGVQTLCRSLALRNGAAKSIAVSIVPVQMLARPGPSTASA